jgi:hypothetical protein
MSIYMYVYIYILQRVDGLETSKFVGIEFSLFLKKKCFLNCIEFKKNNKVTNVSILQLSENKE